MENLKRSQFHDKDNRFAVGTKIKRRGDPRIYVKGADGYLYVHSEPEHLPGSTYTDHKGERYRVLLTGQHVRVTKKSKLTKAQRKAMKAIRRVTKGDGAAIIDDYAALDNNETFSDGNDFMDYGFETLTEQQAADKESMILNSEEV